MDSLQSSRYLPVEPFCLHYSIKCSRVFSVFLTVGPQNTCHSHFTQWGTKFSKFPMSFSSPKGELPGEYIRLHLNEDLSSVISCSIFQQVWLFFLAEQKPNLPNCLQPNFPYAYIAASQFPWHGVGIERHTIHPPNERTSQVCLWAELCFHTWWDYKFISLFNSTRPPSAPQSSCITSHPQGPSPMDICPPAHTLGLNCSSEILVQLVLWSDKCVFSFRHSWNTTGQSCCWDLKAFSSVEVECFETEGRLIQEETALRRYLLLAKCERRPHSYPVPHSHLLEITE